MTVDKSYLKSKTLWAALLMAVLPIFPQIQEIMKDNPELVGMFITAVFGGLRVISKGKIVLSEEK